MMNKINFERICRTSNEEFGVHQVGDLSSEGLGSQLVKSFREYEYI